MTSWSEFLEKHDRPRGEMDAGMLFGSEIAPAYRVRELVQLSYRLNLIRPETAVVESESHSPFVPFFLIQMCPSIKKIRTRNDDFRLFEKFRDVEFLQSDPVFCDLLWYNGFSSAKTECVNSGGVIVLDIAVDIDSDTFKNTMKLGKDCEVILDRSECDAMLSLLCSGKPVPQTKYASFLVDKENENHGGFGVVYF